MPFRRAQSANVTETYASVSIQDGATRETSAPDFPTLAAVMPNADLDTLRTFCVGVIATIDAQRKHQLTEGGMR